MTKKERKALQQIMQVLGPSSTSECSGCRWEINEAIRILSDDLGIEYEERRRKPAHDLEAERREGGIG